MKKFQITHYTIRTRSIILNWDAECKPPAKLVEEANAFAAESLLLSILKDAGYQAEYALDAERRPASLRIRIPPGKSASGFPDAEETLVLTPLASGGSGAILQIRAEHQKAARKPKKS
jgi:hypothetical protein